MCPTLPLVEYHLVQLSGGRSPAVRRLDVWLVLEDLVDLGHDLRRKFGVDFNGLDILGDLRGLRRKSACVKLLSTIEVYSL